MIQYAALLAFAAFALLYFNRRRSSHLPLPPGPKKLPLFGNLFGMPTKFEWETYTKWSKELDSDIIHLSAAGKSIIILSSVDAVFDLLDQRSAIYSDRRVANRTKIHHVERINGGDYSFVTMRYGDTWREHRRLVHSAFHGIAARGFRPQQVNASHDLLRRLLENPDDEVMNHIKHMNGALIMSITYGIDTLPSNDPYMETAEAAIDAITQATVPGRYLVDMIPILKYVPAWFIGAGFKRQARERNKLIDKMIQLPFKATKRLVADGTAPHSYVRDKLQDIDENQDQEHQEKVIQDTAGVLYGAGFDTTSAALGTFILAMLANPDVQKRAQEEIDAVVREGHLPSFDDEESLPYVSAIVKEVLRWKPVTPIGVPHAVAVEDTYRGYRIPAGSIVVPNTWAMLYDEIAYPDPYKFNPDRFLLNGRLNPAVRDPNLVFGFGKRVCPGQHMAQSSLWITVASLLAVFDITKTIGEDGKILEPSYEYHSSIVLMPLPFKCSIKPRSKAAADLIRSTLNYSQST
ncbi:cytochrome P450 [Mycena rebaudengoi]|nr:cytochrome P450 [Mycena rebaudengoi]